MIRRRPTQIFSLAFLDCICCGFGAIILLFVLTVDKQDKATMDARDKLRAMAASYVATLAELQQRKGDLERGSNDASKLVLDAQKLQDNLKGLLDDLANKLQYEKQGHKALVADIDDKAMTSLVSLSGVDINWLQQTSRPDEPPATAVQKVIDQLVSQGNTIALTMFQSPQIWQLSERADCRQLLENTSALQLL